MRVAASLVGSIAAIFACSAARADISPAALARFNAAYAQIVTAFDTATASGNEVPTLRDPRQAAALRTVADPSVFVAPLSHRDLDAYEKIVDATDDLFKRYSRAVSNPPPGPRGNRNEALLEVAGLLLAFNMHGLSAGAEILTDAFVVNPFNVSSSHLARVAASIQNATLDTIRTASRLATAVPNTSQVQDILAALDQQMPRIAPALNPATRVAVQAELSRLAEKAENHQAVIASMLTKLRDAPCNPLCRGV